MIGLPGPTLRPADVALFRDTRAAGLILYRRNFDGPAQLQTLISGLEEALGRRLLVATDHEGGRIVMLGRGVTIFPDNLAVGTAGEEFLARVRAIVPAALAELGLRSLPVASIQLQATSTNDGEFFRPHLDNKHPATMRRWLSFTFFLHREPRGFSGGQLRIRDAAGWSSIEPDANRIVLFPPNMLHEIAAVTCPSGAFTDGDRQFRVEDLGRLTEEQRQKVFEACGPDESMQLYGRGIRRRLPTMLGGDQRRIRLVYPLMFSLPGTPVLFYGEEIGMAENLAIEGRLSVRSPMQWSTEPHAGFSPAPAGAKLCRPLPGDHAANVADQRRGLGQEHALAEPRDHAVERPYDRHRPRL